MARPFRANHPEPPATLTENIVANLPVPVELCSAGSFTGVAENQGVSTSGVCPEGQDPLPSTAAKPPAPQAPPSRCVT